MSHPSDDVEEMRFWDKYIDRRIDQKLAKLGIPNLLYSGVVTAVWTSGNNKYASVKLNGASTANTSIPVNPDIANNVTVNTPVWVMAVNYDTRDFFVLARKFA